jgi:thiol-disulfide isomerase/thioredoxin
MTKTTLLGMLLATTCIFCTGCARKTTDTATNAKHKVSAVYDRFEDFKHHLSAEAGNETIHVINFWATWCTQCRKEIPEMVKLERKYKDNKKRPYLVCELGRR